MVINKRRSSSEWRKVTFSGRWVSVSPAPFSASGSFAFSFPTLYIKMWELNSTSYFFKNLRCHSMKSPESCKSINIFVIVLSNITTSQLCFTALIERCHINVIKRSCTVRVLFPVLIIILFYNLQKYFIRLFVLQLFVLWSMSVDNSAFFLITELGD